MLRWLKRLFSDPPGPPTRLTKAQAVALAQAEPDASLVGHRPTMATLGQREGRLTWFVSTPTRGSWLVVAVDDERGQVVAIERGGVR